MYLTMLPPRDSTQSEAQFQKKNIGLLAENLVPCMHFQEVSRHGCDANPQGLFSRTKTSWTPWKSIISTENSKNWMHTNDTIVLMWQPRVQWVRWLCFSGAQWFMEDRDTWFLRWLNHTSKDGFIKYNITCLSSQTFTIIICDCRGQSSLSADGMSHLKGHTWNKV